MLSTADCLLDCSEAIRSHYWIFINYHPFVCHKCLSHRQIELPTSCSLQSQSISDYINRSCDHHCLGIPRQWWWHNISGPRCLSWHLFKITNTFINFLVIWNNVVTKILQIKTKPFRYVFHNRKLNPHLHLQKNAEMSPPFWTTVIFLLHTYSLLISADHPSRPLLTEAYIEFNAFFVWRMLAKYSSEFCFLRFVS